MKLLISILLKPILGSSGEELFEPPNRNEFGEETKVLVLVWMVPEFNVEV